MTTLKLSNKPADAPVAKKAPARRTDPAKRDRSQPFVKPDNQNQKMDSSLHGNDEKKNDSTRQRNHRHDGKPHGYSVPEHASERPFEHKSDENRPLRSHLRAESASEIKQSESKQYKPAGQNSTDQ